MIDKKLFNCNKKVFNFLIFQIDYLKFFLFSILKNYSIHLYFTIKTMFNYN